jgi:hypothetical protein
VDEVHPAIMTTAPTSTAKVKSISFFTIFLRSTRTSVLDRLLLTLLA